MKTKELITDCNGYAEDACSYVLDVLICMLRYEYRSRDLMNRIEDEVFAHISEVVVPVENNIF